MNLKKLSWRRKKSFKECSLPKEYFRKISIKIQQVAGRDPPQESHLSVFPPVTGKPMQKMQTSEERKEKERNRIEV